ncbi:hypothetical protein QTN25_004270 [Entamoeba marina]
MNTYAQIIGYGPTGAPMYGPPITIAGPPPPGYVPFVPTMGGPGGYPMGGAPGFPMGGPPSYPMGGPGGYPMGGPPGYPMGGMGHPF